MSVPGAGGTGATAGHEPRPRASDATSAGTDPARTLNLDWLDPIKAFALLAVLLNHLVESFGPGPWFTNPNNQWPPLAVRLHTFFPTDSNPAIAVIRFAGWLGDAGPGVFIFASGLGLTLAALSRSRGVVGAPFNTGDFYRRRAVRLYPLYVAMHFVILTMALVVPRTTLTFGDPRTLLSAAGLRGLPSLFFAISPSWWFVWLILQLYIVFPLLWRLAGRLDTTRFIAVTIAFTLASRAAGIAWSGHRYYWLTGMFFGSRLAEFTIGMAAAIWLVRHRAKYPPTTQMVMLAATCYVAGLVASFFLWGALVSNLLVTLGLTGLFYGLWQGMRRVDPVARSITWLGVASYAVYLLHQPPLRWTTDLLGAHVALKAVAAVTVLVISVPAAVAIEAAVRWVESAAAPWTAERRRTLSYALGLIVTPMLFAVEPNLDPGGRIQRALCVFLAAALVLAGWLEWGASTDPSDRTLARFLRRLALVSTAVALFVLPGGFGYLAILIGALTAAASTTLEHWWPQRPLWYWLGAAAATGIILLAADQAIGRFAPTEAGVWGELPALTIHPTRGFGLIPNRVTRLRYNDYDYVVATNSRGLPGPEFTDARPAANTFRLLTVGDAFTMPEGLGYDSSYPALLASSLERCATTHPVQVIDGGVTGYGPNEEGPEIQELVPALRPNVIVYQFYVNEWSDIRIDSAARRRGIGLVPSRTGREAVLARSQLVTHLADDYDALVATLRHRPSQRQRWKLLLDYYRRGPNVLYDSANKARMTAFLASIRDVAHAAGSDLVIMFVPGGVQISRPSDLAYLPPNGVPLSDSATYDLNRPLAELRPLAVAAGLPILDLSDSLRRHTPQPVYFRDAWHWNAEGHRAASGAVLATLRERGDLPPGCT